MTRARQPQAGALAAVNILCIGDTHFRDDATWTYPYAERMDIATADIAIMVGRPLVDLVVQLGDHTTNAYDVEFDAYLAWKATVVADLPEGVAFEEVPGNHDLVGGIPTGSPDTKTTAQWAAIMGRAGGAKNKVVDLGDRVRVLLLAPTADSTGVTTPLTRLLLDEDDIAWVDARCSETDRQVVIAFHAPLFETVGPLDGSAFSTYDPAERWCAHPIADIEAMIARHPNLVAWVAGHTHSRTTEVDVTCSRTYGDVTIAAVSACSPATSNPDAGFRGNRISGCLLTVLPDRVEVRYRDHGAGQWLNPVHVVTL